MRLKFKYRFCHAYRESETPLPPFPICTTVLNVSALVTNAIIFNKKFGSAPSGSTAYTACTHEEAPGRHFHFPEAPTPLLEVISNKLLLDGAKVPSRLFGR